jgi:hypothetical protein
MKTLTVSLYEYYKRFFLFVSILIASALGLYFLIYTELSSLIIGIGASCVLLPWSFFRSLAKIDEARKQFQKVTFHDDGLVFENLPLQGGDSVKSTISFENIKNVRITKNCFYILFVPRYEWKGELCTFIIPSGFVPKLQVYSWRFVSKQSKLEIMELLKARNISVE